MIYLPTPPLLSCASFFPLPFAFCELQNKGERKEWNSLTFPLGLSLLVDIYTCLVHFFKEHTPPVHTPAQFTPS